MAVKEYLPNEFAVRDGAAVEPKSGADQEDFDWGLRRFLAEAKTLTRFRHPNLVRVSGYFKANRTAYLVMDYEDGEPLDKLLALHGTFTEAQLKRIVLPVINGLKQVHAAGYLHRDIKPSNVYVRRADESPVLLDFGAARRQSRRLTAVATAGYSPPEQYESEGEQGPWTDVYSLSALCYRAIAGTTPVEAPRRLSRLFKGQPDPLAKLAEPGAAKGYSQSFLEAVDSGLRVTESDRPQSLDEWLACAEAEAPAPPKPPGVPRETEGPFRKTIKKLATAFLSGSVGRWRGSGGRGSVNGPGHPPGTSAGAGRIDAILRDRGRRRQ